MPPGETRPLLTIDPQFQALCPPLDVEELAQLEANLLADGCRDPLVVWSRDGALVLLDGHHRYAICTRHGLAYTVHAQAFASEDEAIDWMIAVQMGRRNLTPEQKSYLRGKQYNLEKRQDGGHGDQKSGTDFRYPKTHERLAEEYRVAPSTIQADGQFAEAVDTLEAQLGADLRALVLQRQEVAQQRATKKQAMRAGKLLQERTVEPLPFMLRDGWKAYHVLEAIEVVGRFPKAEHAALNALLDLPFVPFLG